MKKLSSIWFMWIAFGIGIISMLMMFVPAIHTIGQTQNATGLFFNSASGTIKGAWSGFVGYMLIVVASLGSAVIALPFIQPSIKQERIALISILAAFVVGAVLVFTMVPVYASLNNLANWEMWAGPYLGGFFALFGAASTFVALKKDW